MRAYRVAYDGRPFHGFQRQPDVPTVEGAIFDALRDLGVFAGEKPPGYSAAGRTDAGVSALAQTVALDAPDWLRPRALNADLPETVRAWAAADVAEDFHAITAATWREYVYYLHAPDADDDRAREALAALAGDHDFHNLTPDDEYTVRDLSASLAREGEFLVITLGAEGFPRQLVRRVVSLVRAVGTGAADLAKVDRVLCPEAIDGPEGVPPAPPIPLVLDDVVYDVAFEIDEAAAESARRAFSAATVEARRVARVADHVARGI